MTKQGDNTFIIRIDATVAREQTTLGPSNPPKMLAFRVQAASAEDAADKYTRAVEKLVR